MSDSLWREAADTLTCIQEGQLNPKDISVNHLIERLIAAHADKEYFVENQKRIRQRQERSKKHG